MTWATVVLEPASYPAPAGRVFPKSVPPTRNRPPPCQTVTSAPYAFTYLTQDAVVVNYRALVVSTAQVGYRGDPCST